MCELFGLSSNAAIGVTLSLKTFASHGAPESSLKDGWGIAYYHGPDVRLIKDTAPAATSEWMRFAEGHCLRSTTIAAHIRHATQGRVRYCNTQPFTRELGGRRHVFAHNGNLPGIEAGTGAGSGAPGPPARGRFRPVGDTDSERAFCDLLERLVPLWQDGPEPPPVAARLAVVARFAADIRALGPANFLYSDGDVLFAHADRRKQADGRIEPPGLWQLQRVCDPARGPDAEVSGMTLDTDRQTFTMIASVPLTGEPWRPIPRAEVLALRHGSVAGRG